MIPKRYHLYVPDPTEKSADAALSSLCRFLKNLHGNAERLLKVQISIGARDNTPPGILQAEIRRRMEALIPFRDSPAVTIVAQPPCGKVPLHAEIWTIDPSVRAESLLFQNRVHVRIQDGDTVELWSSGFHSDYGRQDGNPDSPDRSGVQAAAYRSFAGVSDLLAQTGLTFDDIFRQWNYIGHILEIREENGKKIQNYQVFNEIRGFFYQRKKDRSQYPAATGIGMDYPGICIDFVASRRLRPAIENIPLRSPIQTDAFRYGQECLVGDLPVSGPDKANPKGDLKEPPLFERGRCLLDKENPLPAYAMVSGTASIIGQETIDEGNAEKQLKNTLRFIDELALHGIPREVPGPERPWLFHYDRARLYVKPGVPARKLIDIFRSRYSPDCICPVVEAEICRTDLLIEIEADFHYRPDTSR